MRRVSVGLMHQHHKSNVGSRDGGVQIGCYVVIEIVVIMDKVVNVMVVVVVVVTAINYRGL